MTAQKTDGRSFGRMVVYSLDFGEVERIQHREGWDERRTVHKVILHRDGEGGFTWKPPSTLCSERKVNKGEIRRAISGIKVSP